MAGPYRHLSTVQIVLAAFLAVGWMGCSRDKESSTAPALMSVGGELQIPPDIRIVDSDLSYLPGERVTLVGRARFNPGWQNRIVVTLDGAVRMDLAILGPDTAQAIVPEIAPGIHTLQVFKVSGASRRAPELTAQIEVIGSGGVLYTNPEDPLLLLLVSLMGDSVYFFGERDPDGRPNRLLEALFISSDPLVSPVRFYYTEDSYLRQIVLEDGSSMTFTRTSADTYLLEMRSDDGTQRVTLPYPPPATSPAVRGADNSFRPRIGNIGLSVEQFQPHSGLSVTPQGGDLSVQTRAYVTDCTGLPAGPDTRVTFSIAPQTYPEFLWPKYAPGLYVGPGTFANAYTVRPVMPPPPPESLLPSCESLAQLLTAACDVPITPASCTATCAQIGVILASRGVPAPIALKITIACELACLAQYGLCQTIGQQGGAPPGFPNLGSNICKLLKDDRGDDLPEDEAQNETVKVTARATSPAGASVFAEQIAPWYGPIPQFDLVLPSAPKPIIGEFAFEPPHPGEFQTYVARVLVECVLPGTITVMTIVGTDGYSNSIAYTATGAGSFFYALTVPGAECGVQDNVYVTVTYPTNEFSETVNSLVFCY